MLPELHPDPKIPGTFIGCLQFEGREVKLRINPDGDTIEQCVSSAAQALAVLPDIDMKAKDVAARTLLPEYNEHWRRYEQAIEDGTFVEVKNPELNASDFKARLTMTCLEATGGDCYSVFYDDGQMFSGHAVIVTSFDGVVFSDAHAELFG